MTRELLLDWLWQIRVPSVQAEHTARSIPMDDKLFLDAFFFFT
jgi:hypothetical protein